jgi:PIN domain nuclease of toxin-antitoxin system
VRLLLDTHVLLWALSDPARLGPAHDVIVDGRNDVYVSSASAWEITIKRALGKLRAPKDLAEQIQAARFTALEISLAHALVVGELPDLHCDPFDRMLIAQALTEGLTLVTADPAITAYKIDHLHI